ncbi:unnamed protein product [Cylindrotheca closterium]|uniref:Uncharacterized protein n=1 Tax=Cylindrotheca closterium TaxID=2856 RepID=A0AAD2GAY2_9STRA|nr:unnamed protein product [Cylindrotheca closterium]
MEWIQLGQGFKFKVYDEEVVYGSMLSLPSSGSILAIGSRGSATLDGLPVAVYTLADGTWVELDGLVANSNGNRVSLSSDGSAFLIGRSWESSFVSIYSLNYSRETTPTDGPTPSRALSPSSGPSGMAPTARPTTSGCIGNLHWIVICSLAILLPCRFLCRTLPSFFSYFGTK